MLTSLKKCTFLKSTAGRIKLCILNGAHSFVLLKDPVCSRGECIASKIKKNVFKICFLQTSRSHEINCLFYTQTGDKKLSVYFTHKQVTRSYLCLKWNLDGIGTGTVKHTGASQKIK